MLKENLQPEYHKDKVSLEGVHDERFLCFLEYSRQNFIKANDEYYHVTRSFRPVLKFLYKDNPEIVESLSSNLASRLQPLRIAKVIDFVTDEKVKSTRKYLLSDEDNLLKAVSFVYAKKELEKKYKLGSTVEQSLIATSQLWGDHPNSRHFQLAAEKEREKLSTRRKHVQSQKEERQINRSSAEKTKYLSRIPGDSDEYKKYSSFELRRAKVKIINQYPHWNINTGIEVSISNFPTLTPNVVKALRFVAHVDANKLDKFNKEEQTVSPLEIISALEHVIAKQTEIEDRLREKGKDTKVLLSHIFDSKVNAVVKAAGMN